MNVVGRGIYSPLTDADRTELRAYVSEFTLAYIELILKNPLIFPTDNYIAYVTNGKTGHYAHISYGNSAELCNVYQEDIILKLAAGH